jgi:CheY-like chemotaxis protein
MTQLSEPVRPPRLKPSEPKANILLVDDNPSNLFVLRTLLDELDQNLVETQSGEEALRGMLTHEFAVVLLDVFMPGMSGFETARWIRAISAHSDYFSDCQQSRSIANYRRLRSWCCRLSR